MQRSAMSGVYSGLGCGLSTAAIGGLLSGAATAGIAGPLGLLGGALVGDRVTTGRRKLTDEECVYANEVFRDTVDFSRVRITRDSMISLGAPKGVRNVIHLKSTWGHFVEDTLTLSEKGLYVLVHELGHIWQYQTGGLAYVHQSLWAQYTGWRKTGDRGTAYRWWEAIAEEIPWEYWNPEQQATAIEDYNRILRRKQTETDDETDVQNFAILENVMENVWQKFGAPRFFRRRSRPVSKSKASSD